MAILEIKKYPDSVLRKKAEEVKEINQEVKNLISDMIETMEANHGVGLAVTQVGELKKIIVVKSEKGMTAFINPEIIKRGRLQEFFEEGCLSFPELFLKIKRTKEIEIEALNEKGERIKIKSEGFGARVFQHELDHLNGILFIDRISFWQKLKIRKQIKNGFN